MKKLKFLFITLLSVIILTASLVGCEGKKNDVPRVKGLFYKVEKDGNYLYLGGSVHVGKEVKFIDSVEKAYKESIGLGVEVDIQNSIEGFISENKKYFIVVGAGHIVGEDGIIKALEDKGYSITRLE
ncbi:TraB/GumN family protein [Clostridium intestinale]|uniref:TraB/GumN family protein n=1 Tax=Clostridium intestinale TaxID=36845 RepID=UPI002DD6914E|nr:TraB/GumN family protein [Clostridium intestinale]WRY51096.1 TraB/GumN family protein [Clostridium intestinale]